MPSREKNGRVFYIRECLKNFRQTDLYISDAFWSFGAGGFRNIKEREKERI